MTNYSQLFPLLIMPVTGFVLMLVSAFRKTDKETPFVLTLLSIMATWILLGAWQQTPIMAMGNTGMLVGGFSSVAVIIALLAYLLSVLGSYSYIKKFNLPSEFYSLVLFNAFGMSVMLLANDLFILFIGFEIISISAYVLCGLKTKSVYSLEASIKYFVTGSFSSAFLLLGIAFIFGAFGTLALSTISSMTPVYPFLVIPGLILIITGLLFKSSIFPFHSWTADVYEGAPTAVSVIMASAVKAAAILVLVKVLLTSFTAYSYIWIPVTSLLAMATILIGNLSALSQTSLKRLLAYSSIAHAGYLLIGVNASGINAGVNAWPVMLYLVAYVFMTIGSFLLISILETKENSVVTLDHLKGLAKSRPWVAFALSIFFVALLGMPPLAGFWGKFYIYYSAIENRMYWQVGIALLGSLISVFYYVKPIINMYMKDKDTSISLEVIKVPITSTIAIVICLIMVFSLAFLPTDFNKVFLSMDSLVELFKNASFNLK